MSTPHSNNNSSQTKLSPEKYARLKGELDAPYRGLRQFIYIAFGASGFTGAFIFLAKIIAGQNIASTLPNFALQVGIVILMIFLFRLEQKASNRSSSSK
ncbi:MAG: DUF3493 domain-containing protein [Okeania sp. SIO2C2]|uniref:DUF3493 domain-containing protein n=1 Tax=Okeania sp. SIO2C2 TaxID=2607787 RepID=UPI0013B8EE66|nr:DUF3493 domain-containing protein [Okeania sp. SIO2C2]NEP87743.1 DUF3493 domain-containing protein [Okeania sp. SIO2C2]